MPRANGHARLSRIVDADGRHFPSRLGYDAGEPNGRRRSVTGPLLSEDKHLPPGKRKDAVANARDLHRNYEIVAWAVRKHLDYVSSFRFQSRTGIDDLNEQIEALMKTWGRKSQCDVARRHGLARMIRLAEARAVVDGDVGLMKLKTGQLQAIEGDRIRNPYDLPASLARKDLVHGVKVDKAGGALAYCVCRRGDFGGFQFERMVPAGNLLLHAYFDRFDQVRGIGRLTPALNRFRDTYESFDYALAKAKVAQLFGLVTNRDEEEAIGPVSETDESEEAAAEGSQKKFEIDLGRGPFHLDLATGEDAKFLENRTPPTEFQAFMQAIIAVAIKCLDLPFSFFDESFTNFYGSRAGLIQYVKSCKTKREALQELLNLITVWRLALWILDGTLVLPAGTEFRDLAWEWVPDGVPWWKPSEEIKGHLLGIRAGLTSPQRVCMESNTDFFENVDQLAAAYAYAESKGVPLSFDQPSQPAAAKAKPKRDEDEDDDDDDED
ncbi:MAG TPA: phage portal protein [Phycisphaerae bacterium]|nr:phage portal protein [Phycisphaerae bacterium]HUX16386.1 phage portal protein [Phycisphaerae bacterium]